MKIVCTGDIHIGRQPSRVPSDEAKRCSCANSWQRIVDFAIAEQADLVLLTGDVVDRGSRFFEGYGALQAGLTQLAASAVQTVAVAGNHDFDTLPRLADAVGDGALRLLGRGGEWEEHIVAGRTGERVRLVGWSFPREQFGTSPMAQFRFAHSDTQTIGLLHCDLGDPNSRYAPVASAELAAAPVGIWLLGHIHKPQAMKLPGGGAALYPGSPQGMDPGEPGWHGGWMIDTDVSLEPRRVSPAPLRYDAVAFAIDSCDSDASFQAAFTTGLTDHLDVCGSDGCRPEYLSCRLIANGRGSRQTLEAYARQVGSSDNGIAIDRTRIFFDQIDLSGVTPDCDLDLLAAGRGAPASLARLILAMTRGPATREASELVRSVAQSAKAVAESSAYRPILDTNPIKDLEELARSLIVEESRQLLDRLLLQKREIEPI